MSAANALVVLYLGIVSFTAGVFQGICGLGDDIALQVLWRVGSGIAPSTFHGTPLGVDDVRIVAYLSYVRSFFLQTLFVVLLFLGEHRVNERRKTEGLPPKGSNFSAQLTLALMLPSLVGACIGVETVKDVNEVALRIVLGASSLFFALTMLSLHMMRRLETRRIQEVIKEDLMLMRSSQEVQRREEQWEREGTKRRESRRVRQRGPRRDGLDHRTTLTEENSHRGRREQELQYSNEVSTVTSVGGGLPNSTVSANNNNNNSIAESPCYPLMVPISPAAETAPRETGEPGEGLLSLSAPKNGGSHSGCEQGTSAVSSNRVSTSSPLATSSQLERYIRTRLGEISQEDSQHAASAAVTLQAIREIDEFSRQQCHSNRWRRRRRAWSRLHTRTSSSKGSSSSVNSSGSSSSSSSSSRESGSRRVVSRTPSRVSSGNGGFHQGAEEAKNGVHVEVGGGSSRKTIHKDDGARAASSLRHGFPASGEYLSAPMTEKELSESMAGVAWVSTEEVNVGMRECQQRQLEALQRDSAVSVRKTKTMLAKRMDGAVLSGAVVSSLFGGLLGSYTGVGIPAYVIFVLAMNIGRPLFLINYAASSVLPSTLRVALSIHDGILDWSCFPFYLSSVMCGAAGLVTGVVLGRRTSDDGFFMSVIVLLLLTALAMATANPWALAAAAILVVLALVYIIRNERLQPERRVPRPPPNTPATAGEVHVFEQYWHGCMERMAAGRLSRHAPVKEAAPVRNDKGGLCQLRKSATHATGVTVVPLVDEVEPPTPFPERTQIHSAFAWKRPPPLSMETLSAEEPRRLALVDEEALAVRESEAPWSANNREEREHGA